MNLALIPRVRIAHLPTPLEDAPALTRLLGGPRILVKRDDLTGLALGGNKARKAEFLFGAARQAGATAVLTTAGYRSNYLRIMAAAARRCGMRAILYMRGTSQEPRQGNLLLDTLLGAEMVFIDVTDPWSPEARLRMEAHALELERQGERPFVITIQTIHAPLAAISYVAAALELYQQLVDRDVQANYLFTCTGSGITHAGLLLGSRLLHWPLKIVGVSTIPNIAADHRVRVADIVERAARLLGVDVRLSPDEVTVDDRYAGEAYGVPTPGCIRAIALTGRAEALLLDPVYTGKSMHCLMDYVQKGWLTPKDTAVFLHTGGAPNLFTQDDAFGAAIAEYGQTEMPHGANHGG